MVPLLVKVFMPPLFSEYIPKLADPLVVIAPLFSTVILLALLAEIAVALVVIPPPEITVPASPLLRVCVEVKNTPSPMWNDVDLALGAMANKIIVNRMTVKR